MGRRMFLSCAIILILAGLLFGCGRTGQESSSPSRSGPQNHIIGKWEDTEPLLGGSSPLGTLEFFKDGTLLATHFYAGFTSSTGEYKFVDDSHIKLDFGVVLGSYVCRFSLSQDKLILTYPDERGVRTYRRVAGGDS